jgi:hypothetical protein
MKEYVDMRFEEQKAAVAAALEALRDKGTGRQAIWGYLVGIGGMAAAVFEGWRR